ncbi:hypothetical protein [Hyphomicrobium sp. CS1GBMeth3]|uniref:hypothetical protein n=1 Tax=Hyphomicrobium sp. CS1GBMeth3 TaxID=1892845 RepID=UPI00092FEEA1|nr:hypothetical protein [Hyphomicrobium sp. CS1GBMeth3]
MPRFLAVLLGILCVASPVAAQEMRTAQALPMRQACAQDYMRFCRGVLPGGGRIIDCLNANAERLSQTCFQTLALRGLSSAGALRACTADYNRLCRGTVPGWGRGLACLVDNLDKVSPTCRNLLDKQPLFDDEPRGPDGGR